MTDFYDEMRSFADEMLAPTALGGLGQPRLELVRIISTPAANPWDLPTQTEIAIPLRGVASGVKARLVDGSPVFGSDSRCTCSTDGLGDYAPQPTDILRVNGVPRTIIEVKPGPEAGDPVVWRFVYR